MIAACMPFLADCHPGYAWSIALNDCVGCAAGTYGLGGSPSIFPFPSCTSCPKGYTTSAANATSAAACSSEPPLAGRPGRPCPCTGNTASVCRASA